HNEEISGICEAGFPDRVHDLTDSSVDPFESGRRLRAVRPETVLGFVERVEVDKQKVRPVYFDKKIRKMSARHIAVFAGRWRAERHKGFEKQSWRGKLRHIHRI